MAKIKNDRAEYLKRADISSRKTGKRGAVDGLPSSAKRVRDFMTAPIDDTFYIDLRSGAAKKR